MHATYFMVANPMPSWLPLINGIAAIVCLISTIVGPILLRNTPRMEFTLTVGEEVRYSYIEPYALIILFLLPSVIEHTIYAAQCKFRLGQIAIVRWISYSISAPIMIVLINFSVDIRSIYTNVLSASLIAVTIYTGYMVDYDRATNGGKRAYLYMTIGFITLSCPFILIWTQYSFYDTPAIVDAIVVLMSITYYSFGFITLASVYYKEEIPYYKSHGAFVINSIASKMILAWLFISMFLTRF